LQNREVAERLQISPRTVEVYKAKMMEKLRCKTLADVIRFGAVRFDSGLRKGPLSIGLIVLAMHMLQLLA
jgi:hypothetical protein